MDSSAQALSTPSDSKSAKKGPAVEAKTETELDYSKPIELVGIASPFAIGNDQTKGVRCSPVQGRVRAGTIDGVCERMRYLPGGGQELRVRQLQTANGRKAGEAYYVIISPSGMTCEVSQ